MADAPKPDLAAPHEGGEDDALIMVPLALASSLGEEEIPAAEPPAALAEAEPVAAARPSARRVGAARAFADLMGDDPDVEDGIAADIVDAGRDLVLWGVSPTPDAVAITPELDDWSDPEAWRDALDELDLPPRLEDEIAALADEAIAALDAGGEESVRRTFVARLGDLLRQAGVEALAVQTASGFDWIALNGDDFARESDGGSWAAPKGDGVSLIPIGVSLGLGGRVSLWPPSPLAQAEQDAARDAGSKVQGPTAQGAEPKPRENGERQPKVTQH
jgi:hypothetical protein